MCPLGNLTLALARANSALVPAETNLGDFKDTFSKGIFWGGGGEFFYLQLELFLLAVELFCLQSVEVLFRHAFPL